MQKILFITIQIFLFSFITFTQTKGKIKKYKIKGVTETVSDSTNKVHVESILKFDKNANIIFEEQYSKKGVLKKKYSKKYNKSNELVEQTIYNEQNEVSQIVYTEYNLDLPVLIITKKPNLELIQKNELKYNGFGEKTEELIYDSLNALKEKITYEYDNKGLKISKTTVDKNNKLIEIKKYSYEF